MYLKMNSFPSYVPNDLRLQKLYTSLYRNHRYNEVKIQFILKLFDLDASKLAKDTHLYFVNDIDTVLFRYILECVILLVKDKHIKDLDQIAKMIKTFSRSEITKSIQFLYPGSKKYSLAYFISTAATYTVPKLNYIELLKKVAECPSDKKFSLDLNIYVDPRIPGKYLGILPIISNSPLTYEYVHHLLFGCDSSTFENWLKTSTDFLCIDNGKTIPENKASLFISVSKDTRVVSETAQIFPYTVQILDRYKIDSGPSIPIATTPVRKSKRKTIPKAVKNQLWRQYFADSMKGRCFCCQGEINALEGWEAGHVQAVAHGGSDSIDNLRPVCSTCNKSMGTMNMDEYKNRYLK